MKLGHDERGDDDWGLDDPDVGDVGDAGVYEDGGIQEEGLGAADLLCELDVGDDEAEIVLRVEDGGDAEVCQADADEDLDGCDEAFILDVVDRGEEVQDGAHGDCGEHGGEQAEEDADECGDFPLGCQGVGNGDNGPQGEGHGDDDGPFHCQGNPEEVDRALARAADIEDCQDGDGDEEDEEDDADDPQEGRSLAFSGFDGVEIGPV